MQAVTTSSSSSGAMIVGASSWCGVGVVIRESIDLSEYLCEYARVLPVQY